MSEPMEREPEQPLQPPVPGGLTFFKVVKYAVITVGVTGAAGFAFVWWQLSHFSI